MPNPTTVEVVDNPDVQVEGPVEEVQIGAPIEGESALIEVPVQETKPGTRTTEFWVLILAQVLIFLPDVLKDVNLPDTVQLVVSSLVGLGYILSRGIAKKGVPYIEAQ